MKNVLIKPKSSASLFSPASASYAICVSAIDYKNKESGFSNYGSYVDLYAPGVNIISSYKGSDTITESLSGTSMSSPHVAGLAAYYISSYKTAVTPQTIRERIL